MYSISGRWSLFFYHAGPVRLTLITQTRFHGGTRGSGDVWDVWEMGGGGWGGWGWSSWGWLVYGLTTAVRSLWWYKPVEDVSGPARKGKTHLGPTVNNTEVWG